jgi:hypothetical protein
VDKLYELVKETRGELRSLRKQAGLHPHPTGPHIDPAGHHEGDSVADRERERGEGSGHEDGGRQRGHSEDGERGHGKGGEQSAGRGGEEDGGRISKLAKHVKTYRNGARLTLQYNPATQAFVGQVENTTGQTLSEVRVEVHLSNGLELGPTKRIDLKPGATLPVELSALDQEFKHWVTHPEAGVEEAHGPGEEETEGHAGREASGEHGRGGEHGRREKGESHGRTGGGEGSRPAGASLRPMYNQLQLLRGELRAFASDAKTKRD